MTPLVPSIVKVLMNKIALWISNRGNDWTAESAMIASNAIVFFSKSRNLDELEELNRITHARIYLKS